MASPLPDVAFRPLLAAASRRSFLRYSGAGVAVGGLWLAGCKSTPDPVAPALPTLTSFSPASGMPGATVTLTGTYLTGATAVKLGSVATSFTVVNATTITLTVPAAATSGVFTVTTPAGTATSSGTFTVTAAPATAPTIASFTPASALPGASVTVTGTNLTGATALTVNGSSTTLTVQSATSLTFVVPATAQAGLATVVVTAPGGTATNNTVFTVLPSTVSVGSGDVGVLNYAYALEQLEAAFYTAVRGGGYYMSLASASAERLAFDDLYYHEVIHRDFFKAAITAAQATPLIDLTPDFSSVDFSSRSSVLRAAMAFEDLGVAAYNGAGSRIQNASYLVLAGKIVSVEARHAALIRDLVSESTFIGNDVVTISEGTSLERSKDPATVAAVANLYLAPGSKLDVSGIQ